MRILGFSTKWPKLRQLNFTTFRCERKDRDWGETEMVQVVYRPRSKDREPLGIACIILKEPRSLYPIRGVVQVTEAEAIADGFDSFAFMRLYFERLGVPLASTTLNKLTLTWAGEQVPG